MPVAEKSTFVKIDRNIRQWRWFKDGNTLMVWLWLILSANIEDHDFRNETIRRGEIATSRRTIMRETGLTEMQVRTALNHLKSTGEITVRYGSNYQVITIVQYDQYQSKLSEERTGKQPARNRVVTGRQPQSKNTRTEEGKNEKNMCVATHIPSNAEIEAFFQARGRSAADAAKFRLYNSSKGWKVGKTPIADWQSVAEMWIAQGGEAAAPAPGPELDAFGRPIKPRYE